MRWFMFINLAVLASCAVEAGNPSTKNPTSTGTVSIQFAKTEDNEAQSFQLTIDSIELTSETSTMASLSPDVSEIELFSGTSNEDIQAVKEQAVPVGKYAKIYIRLNDKKPPVYRRSGKQMTVEIDHLENRSFYFAEEVEVVEGQETLVLVNLDPRRSLVASKDRPDNMVFEPLGSAFPKPRGSHYEGTAPSADAIQVCAYAYDMKSPMSGIISQDVVAPGKPLTLNNSNQGPDRIQGQEPRPDGDDRHRGSAARPQQVFSSKDAVVKDENSMCENAFMRAPVMNQRFVLKHLPPGSYALRFFKTNGTHVDGTEDIKVPFEKK